MRPPLREVSLAVHFAGGGYLVIEGGDQPELEEIRASLMDGATAAQQVRITAASGREIWIRRDQVVATELEP